MDCPVCFEPMTPCYSYGSCAHNVCKTCADAVGGQCPMCRSASVPVRSAILTNMIEKAVAKRKYKCLRCLVQVEGAAARDAHVCATRAQQFVARFVNMAEASNVDAASLEMIAAQAIEQAPDAPDAVINEQITDLILQQAARTEALMREQAEAQKARAAAAETATDQGASAPVVYIDFDQFAKGYTPHDVSDLLDGILGLLVDQGRARNKAEVRLIAFGVPFAFAQPRLLHQLNLLQVETRVVSGQKKEETDRQLERDVRRRQHNTTVVLVSSDQDFIGCTRELRREGRDVICVHSAPHGSLQARNLARFASEAWHHDMFLPPKGGPPPQPVAGHGRTTGWRVDKKGQSYTFVALEDGRTAYLSAGRLRGASNVTAASPDLDVYVHARPMFNDASKFTCDVACVESWTITVDGRSVPVGQCAANAGLANALACPGSRALCFCKRATCDMRKCTFIHPRGPRSTAPVPGRARPVTPPPPANSSSSINVEGEMIPKSQLERTAVFDYAEQHPGKPAKWCNAAPCTRGPACQFAHRLGRARPVTPPPPANSSSSINVPAQATPRRVTHINVEGVQVPIEQLQRTALFDYVQKHPEYKPAKWCTKSPCPKGVNCSFAHRKQAPASPSQAPPGPAAPHVVTHINVEGQLIPKEQLERTALFDYVESHPTYQPAKWCTKSPCPKGVHCSFAHRKQAPAGTSQATPRRVTHINVEGVQVPIEQLQRTALFDYVQKHPEYKPAKWCTNSPCPKGVNCSFAHRGRRKPHLTSK